MKLDQDYVLNALLRYNYFPDQKKNGKQIPPVFSSEKFKPEIGRLLVSKKARSGTPGWDAVEYNATRFNGVSRILSIPHPLAYAHLCLAVHDHWPELSYVETNPSSMIKPRRHADGRLFVMDYEAFKPKTARFVEKSFAKKFVVHTDITNFYPSIYSHAVTWGAVGFAEAKKHKADRSKWYNQLDEKLRKLKRNETQGVAIGPGSSNIVAEMILARIDETLRKRFSFYRFIDDYTAFCGSETESQDFVQSLSAELHKFKLALSLKKTDIDRLPQSSSPGWVTQLALALPRGKTISAYLALTFLNLAVDLSAKVPDGSVLKYATKALLGFRIEDSQDTVITALLNLSFHHPVLLPLLGRSLVSAARRGYKAEDILPAIAEEHLRRARADGVCWALYFMERLRLNVPDDLASGVLATKDCLSLMLLYLAGKSEHRSNVISFAKGLDRTDYYELDQYWILLYQLYLAKKISNPYSDEDALAFLKGKGISFLRRPIG